MKKNRKNKLWKSSLAERTLMFLFACFTVFAAATLLINAGMIFAAWRHVYSDIEAVPPRTAIMVLGSQVIGTRLSPVLQDRVDSGIMLMDNGRGRKLILSGDHGQPFYDEVNAMRLYVLKNAPHIEHGDIFLDYAGFNTWDSMYRAINVFGIQDLIIVTQEFHISRAVCMARSLGIDAVGFSAGKNRFTGANMGYLRLREYFARVKALYSIVARPSPRFLGEKIPITGDGRRSWDSE